MRILVTGRDGQVARSVAARGDAHELIFAGRPELNLTDAASIERSVERIAPDLIVSAAAYTAVDRAESDAAAAMATNGDAPGVLARAAAKRGASIIHLSTDYVFDGSGDRAWREDDQVAPLGVYGETKLAGERAVAASGARHAIIRTAWVFSPFGHNFVKTMLRLARDRASLTVVDDQVGCPTSAFDIADAILAVARTWQAGSAVADGVFHFAGLDEMSWASFARAILAESASRGGPEAEVVGIPTSAYPTPARRPANSRLDSSRFSQVFGLRAQRVEPALQTVVPPLIAELCSGTAPPTAAG